MATEISALTRVFRRGAMQEAAEPTPPGQHSYPTNRRAKPREG